MIVLKIFILFLPLLSLAMANFEIGPFHRSPPALNHWGSPTTSTKPPTNEPELKSFPTKSPHNPSQSVHVITPVPTEKSVVPPTIQPKFVTEKPVEIQTSKSSLPNLPKQIYKEHIGQEALPYHGSVSRAWRPPAPPTLPSEIISASPPAHVQPPLVNSAPTEKSPSLDPTSPSIIITESPVEITTPKPSPDAPHNIHVGSEHQDASAYHVKPASNPWIPPKFSSIPSIDTRSQFKSNAPQPGYVRPASYLYRTPSAFTSVVQNIPEVPTSDRKKFSTDPLVEMQTSKPLVTYSVPSVPADNRRLDTKPYYIPRPAPRPWIPPQLSTNSSVGILKASQPTPLHVDKRKHIENGPYVRPQRSADAEYQQGWNSFIEDRNPINNISQLAESTSRPENYLLGDMCPEPYGYFKHSDQCEAYIECKNYIPLAYMCPDGLNFNPQAEWMDYPCDHPTNVICNKEPTPQPTTVSPIPTQSPNIVTTPRPNYQKPEYMCPRQHGYFKFSEQCGEYIECKNYVPLIFSCPAGLHFNPLAQWTEYPCEHPSIVLCERKPNDEKTPRPTSPTTRPPQPTTRPPPSSTRPPPPPPPTTRPLPPTTRPLPPTTRRPPPPPPTTRPPPPPPPTTRRPLPPPPPPTTRRPSPPITWRPPPTTTGVPPPPTTRPPPPTTRPPPPPPSSSTTRRPLPPPPTRPPPPTTTTSQPSTPGPKNPPDYNVCPQPHGYFKITYQCGEYIECKNYVPLMFTCPVGLHFNPLADWTEYPCDHPSKVQCDGEPVDPIVPFTTQSPLGPTTTSPAVTTPHPGSNLNDFKCPQAHGYFEHIECSEYIECKNHVPLAYSCPGGLYFNVYANWTEYPCDHPSNVQCDKDPGNKDPNGSSKPNVDIQRPPIETPSPTVASPQPTEEKPYVPRLPTEGTASPPANRPSQELQDFYCQEPNAYYSIASQCDTYIECKSYIAIQHFCPAGLHFNSKAQWPHFPCDYPSKVQCNNGSVIYDPIIPTQPTIGKPQPTKGIPRPTIAIPQPIIGTPQPTIGIPPPPIGTPQPTIGTPLPSNKIPRPTIGIPRPAIGIPRPTIGTPQPTIGTPLPSNKIPRPTIGIPRPAIGIPRPTIGTPEPTTGTPLPTKKIPRPTIEIPRPAIGIPQPTIGTPPPTIEIPRPTIGIPRPTIGTPQPTIGTPPPTFEIPRPTIGIPQPTIGTPQPTIGTPQPTRVTPYIPTQANVTPSTGKRIFNYSCKDLNAFYSVASQCDVYVECKGGMAIEYSCPDGLRFNPNAQWPDYPCGYPSEVKCGSGDVVQQPNPTSQCPRREGFFPTESNDCGEYIVCHAGVATIEYCPAGLVFNFEKDTCDWPINVPGCNQARALEGFVCPVPPRDADEQTIYKYRYRRSCKDFVACQGGQPRLLRCDGEQYFNKETESCVDPKLVTDCDAS